MEIPLKISTRCGNKTVLIMAGGSGTRMGGIVPKQLMNIGMKPMMVHLLDHAFSICSNVILVLSEKNKHIVLSTLLEHGWFAYKDKYYTYKNQIITICIQPLPNGTGGALIASRPYIDNKNYDDSILILSADVPLITKSTMIKLFDNVEHPNIDCVILAKETLDNYGYGRIVQNSSGFVKIVEQVDCTYEEKTITLINTGTYCFKIGSLIKALEKLTNSNNQHEYYITDCPKIILDNISQHNPITIFKVDHSTITFDETLGANTLEQLEQLNKEYLKKFTIEKININDINVSDYNIKNLIRILQQLSPNSIFDPSILTSKVIKQNILDLSKTKINHNHTQLFAIKYEDTIIGTGSVIIDDKLIYNSEKVSHIEDIVLDKEYRGLGLGKNLVQCMIEYSKSQGIYKIILNTTDEIKRMYKNIGFKMRGNIMILGA